MPVKRPSKNDLLVWSFDDGGLYSGLYTEDHLETGHYFQSLWCTFTPAHMAYTTEWMSKKNDVLTMVPKEYMT
mgnify:CR=1 FL=1